ncbi:MAG TPA: diguanylate cyclase [Candidatus Hydrogenedens sp.]|nr:diguanylate cyclase [Candidatus Hydrogenedens sp.]
MDSEKRGYNVNKKVSIRGKNKVLKKEKILVVDDDTSVLDYFCKILKKLGYSCVCSSSTNEAFSMLDNEMFDLVIVDYLLPDTNGFTFLKKVKETNPDIEVIMMTGLQDTKNAIEALRLGAYDYLLKPFQTEEAKIAIERALEHHSLIIEQKNYKKELENKIKEATENLNKINNELKQTKEYLEQLLNISVDGIFILDPNFNIIYANYGASNILDYPSKELVGQHLSKIFTGGKEEIQYIKQILISKKNIQNYETELQRKNKTQVPVNISLSSITTENNQIHSILAIFKDITTQKNLENELKEMSIKDSLTDLYNQRYFYDRLESEIERAKRQRHPLSLLLFDIDQFKTYNDCHGHLEGDKVLKAVGKIVKDCTREHVDISFRYGGDEFTVILPETDEEQAIHVAERIRTSFESKKFNKLTLSIGVITYKEIFSTRSFIRFADNCMYNAKRAGGNRVFVFKITDKNNKGNKTNDKTN